MKDDEGLRLWERMHKQGDPLYWNLVLRGSQGRYEGPFVLRTMPPMDDFVFVSVHITADRVTIIPYDLVASFELGPERDVVQAWFPPRPGT